MDLLSVLQDVDIFEKMLSDSDLKSILEVRRVFHHQKRRIKGHSFGNFLALYLKNTVQKALEKKSLKIPWDELIGNLKTIKVIQRDLNGSTHLLHTDFRGIAHRVFQILGAKSPPTFQSFEKE